MLDGFSVETRNTGRQAHTVHLVSLLLLLALLAFVVSGSLYNSKLRLEA